MAGTTLGAITRMSGFAGVLALAGLTAGFSQQAPARIDSNTLQRAQQQIQQIDQSRLQARDAQTQPDQFAGAAGYSAQADRGSWLGWVNFNRGGEPALSDGMDVSRAYEDAAGGVRFGFDARQAPTLMLCRDGTNMCGGRAPSGGHVMRSPSSTLRIDFARPTMAMTMMAAPDWSRDVRAELFVVEGWANGDIVLTERVQAPFQPGSDENWLRLTLSGQQQPATTLAAAPRTVEPTTFDYVIVRALNANGGPVNAPFLIDDLRFLDQAGPTPLDALGPRASGFESMLEETHNMGPRLWSGAETLRDGGGREHALYPAARRVRLAIDYDSAEAGARRQRNELNAAVSVPTALGRAETVSVPILAPLGVFQDENPRGDLADGVGFMGHRDFYHLILPTEMGEAVITGTRLATPSEYGERHAGTLMTGSGYDGARASFSLYGAAYSVRMTCEGVDAVAVGRIEQPPCNDPAELDALLERLFLFLPPEGDRR